MDIAEPLEKCAQQPGISVRPSERGAVLTLRQEDGEGAMEFIGLLPGVTLAYISIRAASWPAPDLAPAAPDGKGPLIINYCVAGRCELELSGRDYAYLAPRQLSLTEQFALRQYRYPRREYDGVELFIDLDGLDSAQLSALGLEPRSLPGRFCPEGGAYSAAAPQTAEAHFKALWELANNGDDGYTRHRRCMETLALLGVLEHSGTAAPHRAATYYTESQVLIARRTEELITRELDRSHPARELAALFSVSETSVKNYFRGVYGQNISDYLREARMKRAAELLVSTRLSVSDIAAQVGYANQSKFSAVFRKTCGAAPMEYRRAHRVGKSE